jgi:hypothetical protein
MIQRKYTHTTEQPVIFNTSLHLHYSFYIVYYINCTLNQNYLQWITNHLDKVQGIGGELYLFATINPPEEQSFREKIATLYPRAQVHCNYTNQHEYPGILKVWELGQQHSSPTDVILYFQSKGITHESTYNGSGMSENRWTVILENPGLITEIFDIFPGVDKIGALAGGIGWIWYNFWFARGSYLNRVERPILTDRRHYYEDWLARVVEPGDNLPETERCNLSYYPNTLDSCYNVDVSLGNKNLGWYYDPADDKIKST